MLDIREFVDLEKFQEIQDMFSEATGLAAIAVAPSFELLRDNPRAGLVDGADPRAAGSIGTSTPDGEYFGIEILWPTEEEFERLKGIVSNVSGISTGDEVIADTVYGIGARALEGGITPEEAVKEIVKKSAIYLAE